MKVLVCGGREYGLKGLPSIHPLYFKKKEEYMYGNDQLDLMLLEFDKSELIIVHGCATGGDTIADDWAKANLPEEQIRRYPADWKLHGRAAGPIRNRQMFDTERPDQVWAFPGNNGTADMKSYAMKKGVRPIDIMQK